MPGCPPGCLPAILPAQLTSLPALTPTNPPPARQALFETYFVFAAIWAFGGALVEKDGVDDRRKFDKWWKATWTAVKMPGGCWDGAAGSDAPIVSRSARGPRGLVVDWALHAWGTKSY